MQAQKRKPDHGLHCFAIFDAPLFYQMELFNCRTLEITIKNEALSYLLTFTVTNAYLFSGSEILNQGRRGFFCTERGGIGRWGGR